jgi:hypothetical protein
MSTKEAAVTPQPASARPVTWARIKASAEYRIASRSFTFFEKAKRGMHGIIGSQPKSALFIFGAQRSGTTHLERLFRADPRSVVHGEFSALSIQPDKTVWPPLAQLRKQLETSSGKYVVARSLLASHRASEILDAFPTGRAVWMFRPAEEVVNSMLHKWGGKFEEISRGVETDDDGLWELEALWNRLATQMVQLSDAVPGSQDWHRDLYGLYWHARNGAYFDIGLHKDPRISLLSYRSLQTRPADSVGALVRDIGLRPAWISFPLTTRGPKPEKHRQPRFSAKIQTRCDDLYARLGEAEAVGQ